MEGLDMMDAFIYEHADENKKVDWEGKEGSGLGSYNKGLGWLGGTWAEFSTEIIYLGC